MAEALLIMTNYSTNKVKGYNPLPGAPMYDGRMRAIVFGDKA